MCGHEEGEGRLGLSTFVLVQREGPSRFCNYRRTGNGKDMYVVRENGANVHTNDSGGGTRLLVFDPSEVYDFSMPCPADALGLLRYVAPIKYALEANSKGDDLSFL